MVDWAVIRKFVLGSPRRVAALALAVASVASAGSLGYLAARAARADKAGAEAWVRYDDDRKLAGRYGALASETIAFSMDATEARSSDVLQAVLKANGLSGDFEFSNPQDRPGGFKRVQTAINISQNAPLFRLLHFLQDVEAQRHNVALIEAWIERQPAGEDLWKANFTYVGLIQPLKQPS